MVADLYRCLKVVSQKVTELICKMGVQTKGTGVSDTHTLVEQLVPHSAVNAIHRQDALFRGD